MSNRFFWDTHFPDIDDGFKRYLEEMVICMTQIALAQPRIEVGVG